MSEYQPLIRSRKYSALFNELRGNLDAITATINEEIEQARTVNQAYDTLIELLNKKINMDYAPTALRAIRIMQAQHSRFLLRQLKIANANDMARKLVEEIDEVYASTLETGQDDSNELELVPDSNLTEVYSLLRDLLLILDQKIK